MEEGADNTYKRIGIGFVSGVTAAWLSAPAIAVVDAAITSNASGRQTLGLALRSGLRSLFGSPKMFFRSPPFLWITAVYSATYVTANTVQALCEQSKIPPAGPKFASTSAANVLMSIAKDRAFAKMYAVKASTSFPLASLALFAARDSMTVLASFTLPPILTPHVQRATGMSFEISRGAVQLLTPLAIQILSVPLHLLALDLYNRPESTPAARRAFIAREYAKTLAARWARIFPAFGVGGVVNLEMQDMLRKRLNV